VAGHTGRYIAGYHRRIARGVGDVLVDIMFVRSGWWQIIQARGTTNVNDCWSISKPISPAPMLRPKNGARLHGFSQRDPNQVSQA